MYLLTFNFFQHFQGSNEHRDHAMSFSGWFVCPSVMSVIIAAPFLVKTGVSRHGSALVSLSPICWSPVAQHCGRCFFKAAGCRLPGHFYSWVALLTLKAFSSTVDAVLTALHRQPQSPCFSLATRKILLFPAAWLRSTYTEKRKVKCRYRFAWCGPVYAAQADK